MLDNQDLEVIINFTSTIKHSAKNGSNLSSEILVKLTDILNDSESCNLIAKQSAAAAITYVSYKIDSITFWKIKNRLIESFSIDDPEISQSTMRTIGNYFWYTFDDDECRK
jgi:hypothetical protein